MNKLLFLTLFSAIILVGCNTITIKSDYDSTLNFSKYRTYRWMPRPEKPSKKVVEKGSFLDIRIKRAVERELESKGYVVRENGPTDALLAYHVTVREMVGVTNYGFGYGWWYGRPYVNRYKEGTLVIDIVDPELKQLAWRGIAVGALSNVNESEKSINTAVGKIFERYPPRNR